MKSKLGFIENAAHFSVWTLACFYSLFKLYEAQTEILGNDSELQYSLGDLNPGWRFLCRFKDESDVEWSTWKYLIEISWFYMILQFIISEILRHTCPSILKHWYLFSSMMFTIYYLGMKQLFTIMIQPFIFSLIIFNGGKKKSIWLTSIIILIGYNSIKYNSSLWGFLDCEYDEEVFLMLYGIAWVELKCISFCLDYIERTEKVKSLPDETAEHLSVSQHILNMFSYVMYLPVLFVGPIILYEEFEKSLKADERRLDLSVRLKRFIWDMMLYAIYTVLLELAFHYIYFLAMQNNLQAIKMLPSMALCGGGLWMGLEFHLKYVISYGTTTAYAKLDHIDAPPTPRCIARIHVYSQMWRYFDVGLYRFLFRYIYTPVYNTLKHNVIMSKISYKLLSSLTTFIFIFMWHGTSWNIFVWATLNYFGIVLEYTGKAIGKCHGYVWFKDNVLRTEAMEVRFIAFLCAPLLGMSAISNFYLFAGSEVGDLYFGLMRSPLFYNCAMIYVSLYCSCHVAIALQDVPSRTDVKRETIIKKTV